MTDPKEKYYRFSLIASYGELSILIFRINALYGDGELHYEVT